MKVTKDLNVVVRKLPDDFVNLVLNRQHRQDSFKICEKLVHYHISNLFRVQSEEARIDFPDDIPADLTWRGTRLKPAKKPERKNYLEKEAKEYIGEKKIEKKRRSRFSGTYNDEQVQKAMFEVKCETNRRPNLEQNVATTSSKKKPKKSVGLTPTTVIDNDDSSCNFSELESGKRHYKRIKPLTSPIPATARQKKPEKAVVKDPSPEPPATKQRTLSSSSSEEEPVQPLPEIASVANVKQTINQVTKSAPIVAQSVKPSEALKGPGPSKPVAQKRDSKDQAKAVVAKYTAPPLIEPPMLNMKTNKPLIGSGSANAARQIKRKKPSDGRSNLGGIFAIDNGWEKTADGMNGFTIPKKKPPSIMELPSSPVNQPTAPLQRVHVKQRIGAPLQNGTQQQSGREKIVFVPQKEQPTSNKFNRRRNSSDESSSDDDDKSDSGVLMNQKKKSLFSESEDEAGEVAPAAQDSDEEDEPVNPPKRQKLASLSEDENADQNNNEAKAIHDDGDDDAIELLIDDDPDFFEDEVSIAKPEIKPKPAVRRRQKSPSPPTNYTTELDELKLIVRKELPPEPAKQEFERNTSAIAAKLKLMNQDNETNQILRRFFANVCAEFLDDKCSAVECSRSHDVPTIQAVRIVFERAQAEDIAKAYGVSIKYPQLSDEFIPLFAEMFVLKAANQKDYEQKLAQLIMFCERTPRTHGKYRAVADALVKHAKVTPGDAIKFVIKHRTNSLHGQEVILNMIADMGPDIVQLMGNLHEIFRSQTVPLPILDKILAVCVKYQEPQLPRFILNNLFNKQQKELRQLNNENVKKFMELQMEMETEDLEVRQEKLMKLVLNMKNCNV